MTTMAINTPTRCDICNSEAITMNDLQPSLTWVVIDCASCGAHYEWHKKTDTIRGGGKARKRFNALRKRGLEAPCWASSWNLSPASLPHKLIVLSRDKVAIYERAEKFLRALRAIAKLKHDGYEPHNAIDAAEELALAAMQGLPDA